MVSRQAMPRPPQPAAPQSRSFVYVESNHPAANAIFALQGNNADGEPTPLPGSPFLAGGPGIAFTSALGTSIRTETSSSPGRVAGSIVSATSGSVGRQSEDARPGDTPMCAVILS